MDIVLVPSTLTLSTSLFRLTAGSSGDQELLQTSTEWEYSIPPLNRDEFYYRGILTDDTAPVYRGLNFEGNQDDCFVRQLAGRSSNNPAFEILYDVHDAESLLDLTLSVGSHDFSDDVLGLVEIGSGSSLTVYHDLLPATRLFFTITATNQNGIQSFASCSLLGVQFYDRSPPLGRINPIGQVTSHPSMIQALIVLFDESGLAEVQEIAIGRLQGLYGNDTLPWIPFNSTLIQTRPLDSSNIMQLYSFGRVSL